MRSLLLFSAALAVLFIGTNAYSPAAEKLVGLFDRDSVLLQMPDYRIALDSVQSCRLISGINSEELKKNLVAPVNAKVDSAAERLARKKNYNLVMDKKEFRSFFRSTTGMKLINVTREMIDEVNPKPKE